MEYSLEVGIPETELRERATSKDFAHYIALRNIQFSELPKEERKRLRKSRR